MGLSCGLILSASFYWGSTKPRLGLEKVGPTELSVVGSWEFDGVAGSAWRLCHDPELLSVGDCSGEHLAARSCPQITFPPDMTEYGVLPEEGLISL